MILTLAVPDLLTLDRDALAVSRALALLAHYAGAPIVREGSLDALLNYPSAQSTAALAPLAALGAGLDPDANYVLRADPVALVAGRADVALAARIDDLDADECRALHATLNAHFRGDGLAFYAPRPDAWFVLAERTPDITTTPWTQVQGAIYPFLPAGGDAPLWRRWLSEMQMLLHEHPVNAARERRGRLPVTGIWISEGGRVADGVDVVNAQLFAPSSSAGDVARGIARRQGSVAGEPPENFAALRFRARAIVVVNRADTATFGRVERDWLAPAVAALERGTLAELTLLADGRGLAAAWQAPRPAWLQRARAKYKLPDFSPPMPHGDTTGDTAGVDL